ncbi:hypothetical protein BH11PSE6_BH11PSE6_09720 [soil metagenome]
MTHSAHTASRIILATPHAIFRTFVDPEALVNWRAPSGMTAEVRAFDPRPGGGYRMILTYDDPSCAPGKTDAATDVVSARFLELDPDTRIVEQISFESGDPAFAGSMTLTTTLAAVNGGTKITFVAENVPGGISEADHRMGMESALKNLANLLE